MLRIEFERRRRRWGQHGLAVAAGISQSQVSAAENGIASVDALQKLSRALQLAPASVLLRPVSVQREGDETIVDTGQ